MSPLMNCYKIFRVIHIIYNLFKGSLLIILNNCRYCIDYNFVSINLLDLLFISLYVIYNNPMA